MARTTTAANSNTKPSFDFVLSCLPEELSPSSRFGRTTAASRFLNDDDEEEDCHTPSLNIAPLCHNTFVHLKSASPLARLSQAQLLESFRAFSSNFAADKSKSQNTALEQTAFTPATEADENDASHIFSHAEARDLQDQLERTLYCEPEDSLPIERRADEQSPSLPKHGSDLSDLFDDSSFLSWLSSSQILQELPREDLCDFLLDSDRWTQMQNFYASPAAQSLLRCDSKTEPREMQATSETSAGDDANGHPSSCKPCAFFWSKGCMNGDNCQFCHQWHAPKRKKPMKEQKNLMIITREDGKIAFLRCAVQSALTL